MVHTVPTTPGTCRAAAHRRARPRRKAAAPQHSIKKHGAHSDMPNVAMAVVDPTEVRCDVCGGDLAGQCAECGFGVCGTCTATCEECDKAFCDACGPHITPGRKCDQCSPTCTDCLNTEATVHCVNCGTDLCAGCAHGCHGCDDHYCSGCLPCMDPVSQCSGCKTYTCGDRYSCDRCGRLDLCLTCTVLVIEHLDGGCLVELVCSECCGNSRSTRNQSV
jgi:hypothetical protein